MKVQIKITGGLNSNRKILNALECQSTPEGFPFNGWIIDYPSIKEAEKSLRSANKSLKKEGSTLINNKRMRYDSSVAEIIKPELF